MSKKSQAHIIVFLITAVFIAVIILVAVPWVLDVIDSSCKAEVVDLQTDLENLQAKFGTVKEHTSYIPTCKADEVLFVDLTKIGNTLDKLPDLDPLIKDSVQSGVKKNVFLLEDGKLADSFYTQTQEFNIEYPYYTCFELGGRASINFFLEGKGAQLGVYPGCYQPQCTYIPVNASDEEAVMIIDEAVEEGCTNCPTDIDEEWTDFQKTKPNVEIYRKYQLCREEGKTEVEITIKPKGKAELKEFKFYESIPKECIDDLTKFLGNLNDFINKQKANENILEVSVKEDPLIIWSFDEIKEEETISYMLNTLVSEECREAIEGMGIAETIKDGIEVPAIPEIPEIIVVAPLLAIPDITIDELGEKLVVPNLWQYTDYPAAKKQGLTYTITSQENTNIADCSVRNDKQIVCNAKQEGSSDVSVKVENPEGSSAETTFAVTVELDACDDDDNTPYGTCSLTKPKYCEDGTLVDNCEECGCPDNKVCKDDGSCGEAKAKLEASYSNLRKNEGNPPPGWIKGNWWYYDLTIIESSGVGVTLDHRQRCFQSTGCEPQKNDAVAKFGTDKIQPNGEVKTNGRYFWTTYPSDKMTETWYGMDDNTNPISVSYDIVIS